MFLSQRLIMAQYRPDNFCDPRSFKYREKYAEISRHPTRKELTESWQRATQLGLNFESTTFEGSHGQGCI